MDDDSLLRVEAERPVECLIGVTSLAKRFVKPREQCPCPRLAGHISERLAERDGTFRERDPFLRTARGAAERGQPKAQAGLNPGMRALGEQRQPFLIISGRPLDPVEQPLGVPQG
jgi:hypothetical protein